MQISITKLEKEVEEKKCHLLQLREQLSKLNGRLEVEMEKKSGSDKSELNWIWMRSECERINSEKEKLRKSTHELVKAKCKRKELRDDLINQINMKRKELEEIRKRKETELVEVPWELEQNFSEEGRYEFYGTEDERTEWDETSHDSNISIFGSFGRSDSEDDDYFTRRRTSWRSRLDEDGDEGWAIG
eukprot:TRINITY_DN3318_c0_g1_i3.p1 TRINITY_DN3318_c0_g1~~TRINITY_DN3318_c0_g1_i3.p1  ORF type:complete len:188 (-),score=51.04 TRINITY_DN3318_c0_g1_i3:184-747(-)